MSSESRADGLVGSCADCGGLGHRRDLGGQRDGGGRLVQTQLLGVVPPPSPEGAVSQDHGGVAGARADRSDGAGGGEGKGQGLQLGAGLVGGVSLAAVAQLAVDVAPPQPEGTVRPEGGGVVAAMLTAVTWSNTFAGVDRLARVPSPS